uniref:Knottins-like domain-containing protein n=1 Tax=Rhipicephalus zambeziensis TaxID=60191 RepID=A0A224Y7X1_9ACAR
MDSAMASALYSALIIAISLEWISVECCYNNQRVGFCSRARKIFEGVCPGVSYRDCNYFTLRCGCVKNTFRNKQGECVAKADCDPQVDVTRPCSEDSEKPLQTNVNAGTAITPEKPVVSQAPSLPEEAPRGGEDGQGITKTPINIPYPNPVSSLGKSGCPYDSAQCAHECKKLGYPDGMCDAIMSENCYCSGRSSSSPSSAQILSLLDGEEPKNWPYGFVLETEDRVLQLREHFGCPTTLTKCLEECRQHGYFHAFCQVQPDHKCFCWKLASKNNWQERVPTRQEAKIQVSGQVGCESDTCDSTCRSNDASGGFCTQDTEPVCRCYKMLPYGGTSSTLFRKFTKPKYLNLVEATKQFLQSQETIVLSQISVGAWLQSECYCLESTLDTSEEGISRYVGCHMKVLDANHIQMAKASIKTKFEVAFVNDATEIQLNTDSGQLHFGLKSNYKVLSATHTCMLVQVGEVGKGIPLCALWTVKSSRYATNNDATPCLTTLKTTCMNPFFDAYNDGSQCGEQLQLA